MYTIIFLKLWSYVQVNFWCRTALQSKRHRVGVGGTGTFDERLAGPDYGTEQPNLIKRRIEKQLLKSFFQKEIYLIFREIPNDDQTRPLWQHSRPISGQLDRVGHLLLLVGPHPLLRAQLPAKPENQKDVFAATGSGGHRGHQPRSGLDPAMDHSQRRQLPDSVLGTWMTVKPVKNVNCQFAAFLAFKATTTSKSHYYFTF